MLFFLLSPLPSVCCFPSLLLQPYIHVQPWPELPVLLACLTAAHLYRLPLRTPLTTNRAAASDCSNHWPSRILFRVIHTSRGFLHAGSVQHVVLGSCHIHTRVPRFTTQHRSGEDKRETQFRRVSFFLFSFFFFSLILFPRSAAALSSLTIPFFFGCGRLCFPYAQRYTLYYY